MKKQVEEIEYSADADELPSKSQRKRDALQAVDLAKALMQLSPGKRERLQLSAEITDALTLADGIRSNGARKRQRHFIAKLLRGSADYESYRFRYENPHLVESTASTTHSEPIEPSADLQMRDRLLNDLAATMDELRLHYPHANIQLIRQLVNRINNSHNKSDTESKEPQSRLMQSLATALQQGREPNQQ